MVINKKTLMLAGVFLLGACGSAQKDSSSGKKAAAESGTADSSKNKNTDSQPDSVEIASGKVIRERADGAVIETQFDKVKVDFTKGLCQRRSGDITGSIRRADGSIQSYHVDFDDKQLLIKFADGSEQALPSALCVR